MIGKSGTSKTGKLHTYYSCKSAINHHCDMESIKKDDIEDIIAQACQDILTSDNIDLIAKKIVEYSNKEEDTIEYRQLNKALKGNEKSKVNLIRAITQCDDDSTRKILFDELSKTQAVIDSINKELLEETAKHSRISITEVKFFLKSLKKGNINNIKYKKSLINTLVNKVYLYKNKATILFNINNQIEEVNISLLEDVESSLFNAQALPLSIYTNSYEIEFYFYITCDIVYLGGYVAYEKEDITNPFRFFCCYNYCYYINYFINEKQ